MVLEGRAFPTRGPQTHFPAGVGFKRVTWQRLPISKRPEVKSEPGFQIIFSDWLGLPFSEMNY